MAHPRWGERWGERVLYAPLIGLTHRQQQRRRRRRGDEGNSLNHPVLAEA